MSKLPQPLYLRIAHCAYRGIELGVGLLSAAGAVASFLVGMVVMRSIGRNDSTGGDKTWQILSLVLSLPVGLWCGQLAWRLWTGRGRAGTPGLLSPATYLLFGVGAVVALVAILVTSRGSAAGGVAILLTLALTSFGMAKAQHRAERNARRR